MFLPSTHMAAILLLLISFVCLGSWANTLKAAGGGWRFELYYFDFAIGSIALAALAAWTLGMFGSELSFVDRIAVAGLRPQGLALAGGFLFSLGNILLLATVALLGMAVAYPLVFSIALLVWAGTSYGASSPLLLSLGILLLVSSAVAAGMVRRETVAPVVKSSRRPNVPAPIRKSTKGLATGIIGGVLIGGSYPLAESAFWGDLGLGAYAGFLLFCVGIVASTAFFNLFFLNMAIDGERLALPAYLKGSLRQHLAGISGGVLWSCGTLAWLLARSTPPTEQVSYPGMLLWVEGSVVLAALWGIGAWGELRGLTSRRRGLLLSAILIYTAGLVTLAFRLKR